MNILKLPGRTVNWFRRLSELSARMDQRLDLLQVAIGRVELRQTELVNSEDLRANEFKVFSQNGEDGLVQFLIRNIDIPNQAEGRMSARTAAGRAGTMSKAPLTAAAGVWSSSE